MMTEPMTANKFYSNILEGLTGNRYIVYIDDYKNIGCYNKVDDIIIVDKDFVINNRTNNTEDITIGVLLHEAAHANYNRNKNEVKEFIRDIFIFGDKTCLLYIIPQWISFMFCSSMVWLTMTALSLLSMFLIPVFISYTDRLREFKCDRYAAEHGYGKALIDFMMANIPYEIRPSTVEYYLHENHPRTPSRITKLQEYIKKYETRASRTVIPEIS